MANKLTTKTFIERARQVHGDKYDYSKVEYINNTTKVCIICPEHGEFWQAPMGHMAGQGCILCGIKRNSKLRKKWTRENCFAAAKQCRSRSELRKRFPIAYRESLKNSWLNDYTWFKVLWKKKWDEISCEKAAQECSSKREFQLKFGSAYNAAKRNGWINNYTWFVTLEPMSYEECIKEAQKYNSREEFRKYSNRAYSRAISQGWLDGFEWLEKFKHSKWTFEECKTIALKYTTKKDFYEQDKLAYLAASRNNWLDKFNWLTDERLHIFQDPIDFVYAYIFEKQKAVYVGRTIRPDDRDREHLYMREDDSVAKFAMDKKCPVPVMTILESKITIREGQQREDYWVSHYSKLGYEILNKGATGVGKGSLGAIGATKWTRKSCYNEAKKYKSRSEFSHNSGTAYKHARKNGWIDDYTWFKTPLKPLKDRWNCEIAYEEAKKYSSKTELQQKQPDLYRIASREGWLIDYTWLKRPEHHNKKWNYESCFEEAKKYNSSSEFRRNNSGAYKAACMNKWIKDYTWFVKKHKPDGWWTYERCYEEAKKYKSRNEFEKNSSTAYMRSIKNKWIEDFTWFESTGELIKKARLKWTYEKCQKESKKYKSRGEFSEKSPSAWQVAKKSGWLDDFVWLIQKKIPNGYWTYDRCKEEAKKYSQRSHFCKNSSGAYNASYRNGWLDEFFPIKQKK